jgi:acetyl-CoA C-acetyltransferase
MAAGIPQEAPAYGINMLCGSGLKAVTLGAQAILNGDSKV